MSELRIIFADGSSELRPANSPAIMSTLAPRWAPSDALRVEAFPPDTYCFGAQSRGGGTVQLYKLRPNPITVWCIVGQDEDTGALRGEWRAARVESFDEQITRLEDERDFAFECRDEYKRRLCALRMALKRIENSDSARFIANVASSALDADDAAW